VGAEISRTLLHTMGFGAAVVLVVDFVVDFVVDVNDVLKIDVIVPVDDEGVIGEPPVAV
jgi:hypothetical protein